jgi:hypothetical protein
MSTTPTTKKVSQRFGSIARTRYRPESDLADAPPFDTTRYLY